MLDVRGAKLPLQTEGTVTEKTTRNSQQMTRMARMVAWARLRCGGGLKPDLMVGGSPITYHPWDWYIYIHLP